ncbi:MAG TPA: hypothetical protein EYH20_04735 [Leucothrix sp.]|nr:hypothetical protein [Leucothrix sp.]
MDKSRYTIEYINPEMPASGSSSLKSVLFFLLGGFVVFFATLFGFSSLSNMPLTTIIANPNKVAGVISSQGLAASEDAKVLATTKKQLATIKKEQEKLILKLKNNETLAQKAKQKNLTKSQQSQLKINELSSKIQKMEETAKALSLENKNLEQMANTSLLENKKISQSASSLINESKINKQQVSSLLIENKKSKEEISSLKIAMKKDKEQLTALIRSKEKNQKKINSLLSENKTILEKTKTLSLKNTRLKDDSDKILISNKALKENINDLSNQLQYEKQSNANLLYQLSLQKTENVRLSNAIKQVVPNTANLFKNAITDKTKTVGNLKGSTTVEMVKIKDKNPKSETPSVSKEKNKIKNKKSLEKEGAQQNSAIDDIMSAMGNVNISPPASFETKQKKEFVVEVQSVDSTKDLQKSFEKQLDELSQ